MEFAEGFHIENGVLIRYREGETCPDTVVIPDTVTTIGEGAFEDCACRRIVIPGSVLHLQTGAFRGCYDLKEAVLPEGIRVIPDLCFENCTDLKNVVLPETTEEIGKDVFRYCFTTGVNIRIPKGIRRIGDRAFGSDEPGGSGFDIEEVSLPLAEEIGEGAFASCSITRLELAGGLKRIDKAAFRYASLAEVILPEALE